MAEELCGYGNTPRCSKLQAEWQRSHSIFRMVQAKATIKTLFSNPLAMELCPDPSVLLPPVAPCVYRKKPQLKDYVQLPLHLWIPDFFFPDLVPFVPCPVKDCNGPTARRRWHSGGPRLIHGVHSAVYLHCWEYVCNKCKVSFNGWQNASVQKLPQTVQDQFRFALSKEEGVTQELENRIVDARLSGSSLNALKRELQRNRYNRMYAAIAAYYRHCEQYELDRSTSNRYGGIYRGAPETIDDFPPVLHHPNAYFDHPAPSTQYMSEVLQRHAKNHSPLWTAYMQQLTAVHICVDATFKVAKGLNPSASRLLYSMMDMDTGCILNQQMLTHERREDVLPMFSGYASRCRELKAPLPRRVCSDRGLNEANLFHHPDAFPDVHINVDIWHFQQNFEKTLHRGCSDSLRRAVAKKFNCALYQTVRGEDGKSVRVHAEPQHIITTVEALLTQYSNRGSKTYAAVTDGTRKWWKAQKEGIEVMRMCSNPTPWIEGQPVPPRMSSSPLENRHRQLNRVLRMARVSEDTLHALLLHFDFRWNVNQRRTRGKERDWGTYDLYAVDAAYSATERAVTRAVATGTNMWGCIFALPNILATKETFGFLHPNRTLESQIAAADEAFVFSHRQLESIVAHHLRRFPLLTSEQMDGLLNNTVADLGSLALTGNLSSTGVTPSAGAPVSALSSTPLLPPSVGEVESAPRVLLPPQRKMSVAETLLLSTIISKNTEMGEAVRKEDWTTAAGLWNSMARHLLADSTFSREIRTSLHLTHADMVRGAVTWLDRQAEQKVEEDLIQLQADFPTVKWQPVSPAEVTFTEYENTVLRGMVEKWSSMRKKKRVINWMQVTRVWQTQYRTESTAGQRNRLYPRTREAIKSHWFHMEKMEAKAVNSSSSGPPRQPPPTQRTPSPSSLPAQSSTSPPSVCPVKLLPTPPPSLIVSHSEQSSSAALTLLLDGQVVTASTSSLSSSPEVVDVSSSDSPSSLANPSPPTAAAPPPSLLPLPLTLPTSECAPSSSSPSLPLPASNKHRRTIIGYLSGLWGPPQSSLSPSSQPPSTSPLPSIAPPPPSSSPSEHAPSASALRISTNKRWPSAAAAHFIQLWRARDYEKKWKYEDFVGEWPTALYGECEQVRFWNKLAIEIRKREKGTSTVRAAKGKESGRKRTPTKKAAEARASDSAERAHKRAKH